MKIKPSINRIVLYTKDIERMVEFYTKHFDFKSHTEAGDRIIELISPNGGVSLLLHPAAKTAKQGQNCVKLVFDVPEFR
jgi:catechol 2,3-dioxygenase-like lactoylglutathione lyase family enzyme